jgi:hypothetical protein
MYKKIILIILGLGVVLGLGFLAVYKNNQSIQQGNNIQNPPVETPITPIENPTNSTVEFNKEISLALNDKITFSDGLNVTLKEINDSRCKPDVQCFWAGEIAGTLDISGGKISTAKEISLGTVNHNNITTDGYTFSLQNAAEDKITILVQYKKPVNSNKPCFIGGCSSEICSDQEGVVSNCLYSEKFACYKTAKCERQTSGQCGWTPTPTLAVCLSK